MWMGRIQIDQNNIRTDLFDLAPGDFTFIFFSEQSPELLVAGGNQSLNTAVFGIEDQIGDTAQTPAVFDINDIFFP